MDKAIKQEIAAAARKEKERIAKQKALDEKRKTNTALVKSDKNKTIDKSTIVTAPVANNTLSNRAFSVFESNTEELTKSLHFEKNKGNLPWPIDAGRVTGEFGTQVIEGTKLKSDNDGIFITTQIGAKIKSVADGEVSAVFDLGEYKAVLIKHGKYFTTYNMLSTVLVNKGDFVKAGTVLGKVASNLHGEGEFEFQVTSDKRQYQNPRNWLKHR